MIPDLRSLYDVVEATWPPAARTDLGPWVIRDGQGGGKRVSAATARAPVGLDDLPAAETAMRALGQAPLFMIRDGDGALDAMLEGAGYAVVDPVNLYVAPIGALTREVPPRVSTFAIWEPLEIMRDIWAEGGIGAGRIAVMERADLPKTALFGRHDSRSAAVGFVAIHDHIAMVHALEVHARHRRAGMGRLMMRQAAHWAAGAGASHLAVVCTQANQAANGLYASMGFTLVGQYHYRQKDEAMTRPEQTTALDLPMVDPLPEATQTYFDICQDKLGMIPNVLKAHAFDINKLNTFAALYNELMLADSGLSKLEREMIAVVVSSINRCWSCQVAHGPAVRQLSGDPALGEAMVMNYRVAPLDARQRAMLDFAAKVTTASATIEDTDRTALRDVGFGERDIWDIANVAAFFNMTNRVASATGMQPNPEYHAQAREG
jgi:uncharacterized peroxidase-related enzyme